jgi:hypothetical protein
MNRRNDVIPSLQDMLSIHRYRNGRGEVDYFSRQVRPRYSLIELDGKFYDRETLKTFITERANNIVPESLRAMSRTERSNVLNATPFRIFGKAKMFPSNA